MMKQMLWERKLIFILLVVLLILELLFTYSGFKMRKDNKRLGWGYFIFGLLLVFFILYLMFFRLL